MAIQISDTYQAMTSETTQTRLNSDSVKALLDTLLSRGVITSEEAAACFHEISFTTLRVTRREGVPPKDKWKAPTLGNNVTNEGLLEMLGEVKEKKADLEKEEKFLAEAFKVRLAKSGGGVKEEASELDSAPGKQNSDTAGFSLWDNRDVD